MAQRVLVCSERRRSRAQGTERGLVWRMEQNRYAGRHSEAETLEVTANFVPQIVIFIEMRSSHAVHIHSSNVHRVTTPNGVRDETRL